MARGVVLLAALAGAGWWAYQQGHLDPLLERFGSDGPVRVADPVRGSVAGGMGGVSPVLATIGSGVTRADLSKEQRLLWDNTDVLSDWARLNPNWTAAMIWQESRGNPKAVGPRTKWGHALGLMQVLPGTAQQMYDAGFQRFQPTRAVLLTARGSIYFGTAYLQHLSTLNADREWITKAYHGGPYGEAKGLWGPKTQNYLVKVKGHYQALTDEGEMA
jgi:hypothetical protein